MITSIRRQIRNLLRTAPNDAILERIKETESILDLDGEDLQSKLDHYVDTLCESIKIKDVELSILALQALKSFIESKYVNPRTLQIITDTVTKMEFTSIEPELVEEGYNQAVRVCHAMVKCRVSNELTNGSISEIVIFNFRVVNSRLVKWLRSKAARTLVFITRTTFSRLNQFPEDPYMKPSYQIRLRLGGASSQSTFKELADQSASNDTNSFIPPSIATSTAPLSSTTTTTSTTAPGTTPTPATPTTAVLRIITERAQPYNLAFINDLFCYLASLINPNQDSETKTNDDKMLLGLKLLRTAFDVASSDIGHKSCLIYVTRNNICYNIVTILKTVRSIQIMSSTFNLAADLFISLRHHLKYQFEAFLERLMEMLTVHQMEPGSENIYSSTHNNNASMGLRSDVLNTVLELLRNIKHLPHELYYNYDCDPYSSNIYENLVQICSKNCFQHSLETHFTPVQLTSFKCLLTNLADIHDTEISGQQKYLTLGLYLNSMSGDQSCEGESWLSKRLVEFATTVNKFPRTLSDLNASKKKKRLLWLAIEKYNARPKDGIQFIKDNKLIDNNHDLVLLLKDNLRVDKKVLGEFLAKEENRPAREAFIKSLDFTNLRIDEALRFMLEKFRLPGESQLIERILDAFSLHWFEQNQGILTSSDSALSLAYAIIMLNVDQHSKKVKPMTCDEFDRNLLGPKSDRIYDRKLLDLIYTSIRDNEIVLPDEQVGAVRQRYLWKCTMVKSERVNALYWATGDSIGSTPQEKHSLSERLQGCNLDDPNLHSSTSGSIKSCEISPMEQEGIKLPDATVLVIGEAYDADVSYDDRQNNNQAIINKDISHTNDDIRQIHELPLVDMNRILFEIMWSPTVAALSFIFDKIDTSLYAELSRQIVEQGFIKFAHLCAKHGHLDNLVVSLCKFTNDLSLIPHNHSGQRQMMSDKNSLAALSLLSIIRNYANCMRDSWSNVVRNILQWYCSRYIDDVLQVDDFALQRKLSLRMREVKKSPSTMNQQSSTFLRSVYTYFAGQQPTNENRAHNGSTVKAGVGSGIMTNDHGPSSAVQVLIQTIQNAEYCQESLIELISALTTTSIDGDAEEIEDAEVFKLEIFTQVILNNKEQANRIWPRIRAYFARQASICGHSIWLGERLISAAFRVAIQFKPKPEVFSLLGHVIATLDADLIRGDHTFVSLMTLTELHAPSVSMDACELEACFNQVIFPFLDKVLDGCDPIQSDRTLNRAINLLSKIFLKHHKLLKELQGFALLWYAILDTMEKYIKANSALKEATFELVKNMVLVMDNEQCMSDAMKDMTRTKFLFWEFQSGSDY